MSSDDVLLGLGLVISLAVAAQLAARRLGLPAIVVLLPVGFVAGVLTDDVHPDRLLGQLYQPFVSLAVGVVLFEAGMRLSIREVRPDIRPVVVRLVAIGVLVAWLGVALASSLLFTELGDRMPLLLGAILVVSGPTVVLPLLKFVRPSRHVRSLLTWEGVLVDPVGALLGVVVFHAVRSGVEGGPVWRPGEMALSIGAGVLVGGACAAVLLLLLRETQRTAPREAVPAVLMMVVVALVGADLLRDDSGFVATTCMGALLANQRRIDVALLVDFHSTLVQLLIGVLFVLIAASVSPSDVEAVLPEAAALVALIALVIRPLAVALATLRSGLTLRERGFVAWMAPRGIVAGATASAFALQLEQEHVRGADRILPIVFVVIFGTVALYGLTAEPVARALGVTSGRGTLVLVVGGSRFAVAVSQALEQAGVGVRLWAGRPEERDAARAAGLEPDRGRIMVDAMSREAELEEITDALLLTSSDDFNAIAAAELRAELGHAHVFRLAPGEADLVPPPEEAGIVAGDGLTFAELDRRLRDGARLAARPAGDWNGDGVHLFSVGAGGAVRVVTAADEQVARPGDRLIALVDGDGDPTSGSRP